MLTAIAPAQEVSAPVVHTRIPGTQINPYLAERFLQAVYAWLLEQDANSAAITEKAEG